MKIWFWIWAGMVFPGLSRPVQLLHNWPEAGNAMAGISLVCEEDWLDTLEKYYKETEEPESRSYTEKVWDSEPERERMADTELPPKRGEDDTAKDGGGAETAEVSEPEAEAAAVPSNRWGIQLSKEEIDLLACIVWVEARGEPDEGQQAVAEVVFNRMLHGSFPGTLYGVLSERSGGYQQFTSWHYVSSAAPTEKEYRNIQAVLDGRTAYTNHNTVYFSTSPQTRNITCVIGGHYFCE